jgi:aminocarboxymuconate-semialdehyde decarboxylase
LSASARDDAILDCHFHWYPAEVEAGLNRANGRNRMHSPEWSDLALQLARMDELGRRVDVISSTGPFTGLFTNIDAADSLHLTRLYNEHMAAAQREHAGRVWGTCVLPLLDTGAALAELEYAVGTLGLIGVNIPGRIGRSDNLDAPRLAPVYERIEQLGVPVFVHPNDEAFESVLTGYDGALHLSLGRVMDVSVSAYRLVLSGLMERHPDLRVAMSHTGGALPYQAGRMDKNSGAAGLPRDPTEYLRRMYTDTVSPHTMGVRFAIEFYGADHVMYGSDYPCWNPARALQILDELELDEASYRKITRTNAVEFYGLDRYAGGEPARAPRAVVGVGPPSGLVQSGL